MEADAMLLSQQLSKTKLTACEASDLPSLIACCTRSVSCRKEARFCTATEPSERVLRPIVHPNYLGIKQFYSQQT